MTGETTIEQKKPNQTAELHIHLKSKEFQMLVFMLWSLGL